VNEHGVFVPFGSERLAAVLSLPDRDPETVWVLLPGQGAPRGTHYHYPLWTAVARGMADRGVAALRIDYLSIGDSTGRRPVLEGGDEGTKQALVAAAFARDLTGARRTGFAGNCYGGRAALEAAAADASAIGVVSAFAAPRVFAAEVSTARRARHRIRSLAPIRAVAESRGGRRVLQPVGRLLFGASRGLTSSGRDMETALDAVLGRARVLFVSGHDEAKYHERLRPFLDRYLPTLPEDRRSRVESVVVAEGVPGGYTSHAAQGDAVRTIVERSAAFSRPESAGRMTRIAPG
jgi:alpha/beta superfamily hydrolase